VIRAILTFSIIADMVTEQLEHHSCMTDLDLPVNKIAFSYKCFTVPRGLCNTENMCLHINVQPRYINMCVNVISKVKSKAIPIKVGACDTYH
jgi:hypothetical protein